VGGFGGQRPPLQQPAAKGVASSAALIVSSVASSMQPSELPATRWPQGESVTDKVIILVTAVNKKECRKIARHLVENKLAACVNITQPVESIYRWEGKIARDREYQLFIKSKRELFPEIKAAIFKLHSYHTPEVICLPVIEGSRNYLQWIDESVKPASLAE
jgi:periplasmic divalent cation tolerance protein